jgi:hypothetical protein
MGTTAKPDQFLASRTVPNSNHFRTQNPFPITALLSTPKIQWHDEGKYAGPGKTRNTFLVSLGIVSYETLLPVFWAMISNTHRSKTFRSCPESRKGKNAKRAEVQFQASSMYQRC